MENNYPSAFNNNCIGNIPCDMPGPGCPINNKTKYIVPGEESIIRTSSNVTSTTNTRNTRYNINQHSQNQNKNINSYLFLRTIPNILMEIALN